LSIEEEEDLEALGRAALERARQDVETYGWHVVLIQSDEEPGFLFTIGLWHSFRHPEILLFAPSEDPTGMTGRLQPVAERVSEGEVFAPDSVHEEIFGRFAGAFRIVERQWYPWFLGTAMAFYGGIDFPVLQLFWPDRDSAFPWEPGFSAELHPFQPLLFELDASLANLPPSVDAEIEVSEAEAAPPQTLSANDLFIELDQEQDAEDLLAEWRWLVGEGAEILRVTVFGDLFLTTPDGHVHWLDTGSGVYREVAADVADWGRKAQEHGAEWFHLRALLDLREMGVGLDEAQVYGWTHPPMLGGAEIAENVGLMDVQVHISLMGRTAFAIKDLPPGTPITDVKFEPV
jgi:hypothetical protein